MIIDYLYNKPEYIETVAKWIHDEFVLESERGDKKLQILKEYFGEKSIEVFPITFVAIENGECAGTISIFDNDLKTQMELTPWLASLYVCPRFRGHGIAQKLIKKVIEEVKNLGYEKVYLRTEHTADYYRNRGWEFLYKTVDEKGQSTEVYEIETGVELKYINTGGYR